MLRTLPVATVVSLIPSLGALPGDKIVFREDGRAAIVRYVETSQVLPHRRWLCGEIPHDPQSVHPRLTLVR